jgi:GT2 family glycosyltransferase
MSGGVAVVVPTLGTSELLTESLAALRAQGAPLRLIVVCPSREVLPAAAAADQVVETGAAAGFAAATNAGFAAAGPADWLGTVNDDVVVAPDWLERLLDAARAHTAAAALQGVNVALDRPEVADGCGLAWNRWLQAVQIGRHQPAPSPAGAVREIFGVSATAALYRRDALESVALRGGDVFDSLFDSYYEDVDLAVRLRSHERISMLAPAARARHAGSATLARQPARRARLVYGNRLLTLRRALGRGFWRELLLLWASDFRDTLRAAGRGELPTAFGMAGGWLRAAARAGRLSPLARPLAAAELRRWSDT